MPPAGTAVETRSGAALAAERGAAGEVARFATLVDRHHAGLLRFLRRQTGDPDLAADLAQETFLAAFRCRHQLRDEAAFPAWLLGIARNQVRMEWRRRGLRRFVSLDWLSPGVEAVLPGLRRPDATRACHERDGIQRALDAMSPALREALLLHGLCGFSGGEVAAILGISPEAARKRIVRAEAEFRRRYGRGDGEDGVGGDALP
jgi:RNA polymerase sigma-70 factor (ECF subfamily)